MASSSNTFGHKYAEQINPLNTNTKTGGTSTNKASPNVTHRHKKNNSSPSILSSCEYQYPAYNPCWRPVAIIGDRYAMGPKIGSGSFGSVHAGVDLEDNYRYIAIKLEPLEPNHHPQLAREYEIYTEIHSLASYYIGIPDIVYFGAVCGHPFNALVMEMLGPSLEKLFNICNRSFSLKTVLMIADQMLSRLELIHDTGYLHRDLKPDNFLMGIYNSERVVYAVDMGLAKRYIDIRTRKHIPYTEGKTLTGTARYASVNTHLGVEQSRRDDLESMGYILMYFLRGRLPWQGIKAKTRHEKYEKIARKKLSTLPEQLCKGYPEEFAHLIRYSWRLGYEERPNYEQLRRMFREVFFKLGYSADWVYDWDIKGTGATKLALENHPFVRGNVPGDRKSKKKRKERENKPKIKNNNNDDMKCEWGGDKHYEHKNKRKKRKTKTPMISPPQHNIVSRPRHSLPILKKENNAGCFPDSKQTQKTPPKRQKQSIFNFACFQSQEKVNKRINTDKLLPNRRQSAVIQRRNKTSSPNRIQKHQKHREHITISPQQHKKRLSQPIYPQHLPLKHQYLQQSQAYSPAHIRQNNTQNIHSVISSSPITYTPSYSHPSSSPSPIHRRYSEHYAAKPIITAATYNNNNNNNNSSPHHSIHSGYLINAPQQTSPLRLERSQSQRSGLSPHHHQHHHHGRRSVILNNNKSKKHKSSAELHNEWYNQYIKSQKQQQKQQQQYIANNNNNNPYYSYQNEHQYQSNYRYNTQQQQQQQQQQQHYRRKRDDDIYMDPMWQIIDDLDDLDKLSDCSPINDENIKTLPLKIGFQTKKDKERKKVHSVSNQSPSKHSPRSNKSNKSIKSHRSSQQKSLSHSPILDETQSIKRKRSLHSNSLNRSSSRYSNSNYNIPSSSGSMLVNAASMHCPPSWNEDNLNHIKSRVSVIDQREEEEEEEEEELDGFKMLETQFTGRSMTTTNTKDDKERKNSGSTSKGLLTERDLSSQTETCKNTPSYYNKNHPFIKNSSNSSTHQTLSFMPSNQTIIEEDTV